MGIARVLQPRRWEKVEAWLLLTAHGEGGPREEEEEKEGRAAHAEGGFAGSSGSSSGNGSRSSSAVERHTERRAKCGEGLRPTVRRVHAPQPPPQPRLPPSELCLAFPLETRAVDCSEPPPQPLPHLHPRNSCSRLLCTSASSFALPSPQRDGASGPVLIFEPTV